MARHLHPGRPALLRASLAAALLAAGGCGDTLLDHAADPGLLGPVCAAPLLACGGQCLSCAPPANASSVCTDGACDFACDGGYNRCGGPSCIAESAASCGPACAVCAAPPNATPVCTAAHACDFVCSPGWLRSGAGCQRATAVSAGYVHTCALLADGKVRCWGANFAGQLGDGTHADAPTPVDVVGLPGPASAIAAGYAHTCALVAGAVWCWGDNTFGEIGDGTTVERPTPVAVTGISQAVALGAGGGIAGTSFGHTCAVLLGGDLRCWGADDAGQLGDQDSLTKPSPVPVTILPAGTAVSAVACGERHTCALSSGGAVYCWGAFDAGQLGTGSASAQTSPAAAAIASGASAVAAGQAHSCAIVSGVLECWGLNSSGQVNGGSPVPGTVTAPIVPALGGGFLATALGAGRAHTCALDTADVPAAAKCFGANGSGQLGGAGNKVDVNLETPPPATAAGVTGGSDHTCALTADGGVQCWGANDRGQLGTGDPRIAVTPPAWVSGR